MPANFAKVFKNGTAAVKKKKKKKLKKEKTMHLSVGNFTFSEELLLLCLQIVFAYTTKYLDGSSFLLCCSHFRFSRAKKERKPNDFRTLQEAVMRKKEEEEERSMHR
jgi:ribosomal protein L1